MELYGFFRATFTNGNKFRIFFTRAFSCVPSNGEMLEIRAIFFREILTRLRTILQIGSWKIRELFYCKFSQIMESLEMRGKKRSGGGFTRN